MENGEILLYQAEDGVANLQVRLENETVWLTQDQMATLFQKSKSTINEHIQHIFEEGELQESLVMRKFGISEFSMKPTNFYNLDVIISVGYRVKSSQGTQFRIWATQRLKEYLVKGFTMNDAQLAKGNTDYFEELVRRVRAKCVLIVKRESRPFLRLTLIVRRLWEITETSDMGNHISLGYRNSDNHRNGISRFQTR